ncbi:hypothetical protein [Mycobacterium sp. Marseille-P9652]|nr:hypothetical protein [Mycobacterium sp. Marseille-P9652]
MSYVVAAPRAPAVAPADLERTGVGNAGGDDSVIANAGLNQSGFFN